MISAICGYSTERINLLRLAFNKLIFPDKGSQQIVYIYGGPKTGKSSIADFIKSIHNDDMKAANFEALNKPFEASNLIHLKIIYMGDVTYLKNVSELKKWQGRDFIQTERKFEHTNVSNCFSGTIFMTSNYPPERAMGVINDEALSSRMLTVPLEFVVIQENPYFSGPFNFTDFLQRFKEDIIYWALTVPEKLREQPRVDLLKYSGSESVYGTLKSNLIYGDFQIPININKVGPIRQFLEERIKLSEQVKPFQKIVGYLFAKTISTISRDYFNRKPPILSIKDFKTENFRLDILDFMYATEFFNREDGFFMLGNKKKISYSHPLEDNLQNTLFEVYFTYRNPYKSPFPETYIFLIDPTKVNHFFKKIGDNKFLNAMREEYETFGEKKKLPQLSGKELFFEYLNWLTVNPDHVFKNIALNTDFYGLFLDEVLVHLKGLYKYPFETTIRSKEGVSFLGIEWRNRESWEVMRESSLLRQFDPYYGEWQGVLEKGSSEINWNIFVKPCENSQKHSLVQVDISFAEYFRCPAIFGILEQFNTIPWENQVYISQNLAIENHRVESLNKFTDALEDPPEQIILSNYLDDHYEKLSAVSRDYLLRSFVFHSGLIANRFDVNNGQSGSYLPSFKSRHNSTVNRLVKENSETSLIIDQSDRESGPIKTPSGEISLQMESIKTPFTNIVTPIPEVTTSFLSHKGDPTVYQKGTNSIKDDVGVPLHYKPREGTDNQNSESFPYNPKNDSVVMKISGADYKLYKGYSNQKINFLKNISWAHVKDNYIKTLGQQPDIFSKRENFIIDFDILNFDLSKFDYCSFDELEGYTDITQVCSSLKKNWCSLKEVLGLIQFIDLPKTYYPDRPYEDLNVSLMLRPLIICFWKNSVGNVNSQFNKLFSESLLLKVQEDVKKVKTNTQIGRRWPDRIRDFSEECFLPESAFYTLNNFIYLLLLLNYLIISPQFII